jgi:SAM-dependent methyltransferase
MDSAGMTENACICCNQRDVEECVAKLIRCVHCGHVWADLRLTPDELAHLYSKSYFQGEEYADYASEASALQRNFRPRLQELAKRFPKGSRLWEIGSAYGFFLKEAQPYFSAAGCDISEEAVRYAREVLRVPAECTDFLTRPPEEPYDIVCMWDTVEHLQAPNLYLEKAAAELRSGGLLALSTGDIGSRHAQRRGAQWRLIHPPTHLHYFSARSMRTLLERLGFTAIEVRYLPFWRTADSVMYHLMSVSKPGLRSNLYQVMKKMGLLGWSFPLNFHDLMTVYAVKR